MNTFRFDRSAYSILEKFQKSYFTEYTCNIKNEAAEKNKLEKVKYVFMDNFFPYANKVNAFVEKGFGQRNG